LIDLLKTEKVAYIQYSTRPRKKRLGFSVIRQTVR